MLDPSCGDGRFLSLHPNSVGVEQNPDSAHAAIERAPASLVHEGDFFVWASETAERFEAAAGNPPFIRYQTFKGAMRKRALDLCGRLGAQFSGLTSSWAPFLVATAGLLRPGGRMAFVVPAEIGHAPYAAPLLDYLLNGFAKVRIIAVREKLFPTLSEDCWLLLAEGRGGKGKTLDFSALDRFTADCLLDPPQVRIDPDEWRDQWNRRLRPYLISSEQRQAYVGAARAGHRLSDFASVGIGYVSGDNQFFHLRPSDADKWNIPASVLQPTLRSGRGLSKGPISRELVSQWHHKDEPMLLLRLKRGQELGAPIRNYLDSSAGQEARLGYKCRNRTPWYAVPDVQIPDFILSYMIGRSASLVENKAGVSCTNSVHAVRIRDAELAAKLLPKWNQPLVRLSCELEGHALGGGMLKLEPREAANILFPAQQARTADDTLMLEDAVTTLRRWRHYAD